MLLCFYGLQSIWELVNKEYKAPKLVIIVVQLVIVLIGVVSVSLLPGYMDKAEGLSKTSVLLPYAALGVGFVVILARLFLCRDTGLLHGAAVFVLIGVMVFSNQLALAGQLGDGKRNIEFKLLADWYRENAGPGEKLLTTMPHIVKLFVPDSKGAIVNTSWVSGESEQEFIRNCYEKKIRYVAWDSRIGLTVGSSYYKKWGISNTAMLSRPRDFGPFEFVDGIVVNQRRYIYIFRVREAGPE